MKMRVFILSLVVLVMGNLSVSAQVRVDNSYIDGVQEYSSGNWQKAADLLDKAIAAQPDNDAAHYYKGLSLMRLRRNEDALASFRKAVSLDTSNYWYRDRLAFVYSVLGEIEVAEKEYEDLVRMFPRKLESYYTLVNLYIGRNELDKAVSAITSIENLQGKNDGTVMTKYQILLHQQKQEEALETLKDYSREYASPQVLSMLGDHETGMYNDSLAVAYYDQALELDSSYAPARLGKAEVFRMTRRYPEYFSIIQELLADDDIVADAKADYLTQLMQHVDPKFISSHRVQVDSTFDIMLEHHPADTSVLRTAGIYYFSTGRQEKAKQIFRTNKENNPGNLQAQQYYVQVLSSMNDFKELAKECDEASKRFPGNPDFDRVYIYAEINQDHYDAVIAKCESMIARNPSDSLTCLEAYASIGDCYNLKKDLPKAYKAYEKALKINPDYAPVLNNYAYYLSLEGKSLKKAYKMSRRTVEQEPDNATFLDTFGWILHLMGKDVEAKPLFKHAMLYGGKDSATILAHYAIVLEALGENDLAEVYRKQAKAKAAEGAE